MTNINSKMLHTPKHVRDGMIHSTLAENLREEYGRRSIRVIKGDNVRVMRGEYNGIEGKIEKVNTQRGTLAIEGIQREKVRGGNVKVQIHASNVKIIGLNLDDKKRDNRLHGDTNSQDVKVKNKNLRKILSRNRKSDEKDQG
ncbi:MAG TPA: 50S ribosomal protein L24 [Nitrososphaeraceae archaeon]|jgi:large subunit ribosomal protein L24|nr:50S ribosomal protein L24 [Nitrososphaeraceae archaeon]